MIESGGSFKAGVETLKEAKKWKRAVNSVYREGRRTIMDKICVSIANILPSRNMD